MIDMTPRRALAAAIGIVLSAWVSGSSAQQLAKAGAGEIAIENFTFVPGTLTVPMGTTVTWTNRDEEPHTIVNSGATRVFKSSALDTDDKFAFTFDKPGIYQYFCSVHPHMVGIVEVK